MGRLTDAVAVVRAVVARSSDAGITFLAAAVAYYAFVSLVPLLLLALAVGTALVGERVAGYVVGTTGAFLTPAGQQLVRDAIADAAGRSGATVVGVLVLAWSALRVFRGLDMAFSRVYGQPEAEPLAQQLGDGLVVLCAVGVAVFCAAAVGVAVPYAFGGALGDLLGTVALVCVLVCVFLPLYYVFPDADVALNEVWPGAAFAAASWTLLADAFRLYTTYIDDYRVYGVLGAAVLLSTWLYVSGTVIMVGAVLNAVLAGRTDETEAEPDGKRVETDGGRTEPTPDVTELQHRVESLERQLDEKTLHRDAIEDDLKGYVRSRVRSNHARGWGPYLVLLYGTVMTLGAFYWLESDGLAILAMVVVWLSTLGLYVLMVLFGAGLNALGVPGKAVGWLRSKQ
ncbi:YihY/virulence factor BrkB family protein [Halarchaeum sp. CBA1220]|uniref:YihY/virulence factor BrkB family protein n=1 Tax=Halarchaeum sp. CBA1220 TaxID=1853682 RepID=UPI000F3A90F0|nr:YihY/virulence factor BrkB family protein [Halarchaeum sp. CBA1220]QLC33186.1 YihY/virulence factor BrkB family protein [Halarchaeum sp. CBA1220]